jgi:hypothetical protein
MVLMQNGDGREVPVYVALPHPPDADEAQVCPLVPTG